LLALQNAIELENNNLKIAEVQKNIDDLERKLYEAQNLIYAIRHGEVDALLLNKNGKTDVYSLESIDYTYRVLIEKFGEGALSISKEGLVLYTNLYFSDLIGLSIGKIVGSYFYSYFKDVEVYKSLMDSIKEGMCKGEVILTVEGKTIPVYISISSLEPNLPGYGIIINDQTDRKQSEETILIYQQKLEEKIKELNRTNSDLEQFVHIVSHDIKEPLRKIISYGGRLKETLSSKIDEEVIAHIDIMNAASLRLNSLVDDLAHYSYTGSENATLELVDLNKILLDILEDIEFIIRDKNAKITWDDLPTVHASQFQIRQLFFNLIINAIKYSREGVPPIVHLDYIQVEEVDPVYDKKKIYYKINISDNGIGMEEQHLHKIFIVFQRLHTPKEYSGTGIGLAICKKIIENQKGKIDVSSVLNVGSTFSIYLPLD
jgi:PAS domain S-box-containing protein